SREPNGVGASRTRSAATWPAGNIPPHHTVPFVTGGVYDVPEHETHAAEIFPEVAPPCAAFARISRRTCIPIRPPAKPLPGRSPCGAPGAGERLRGPVRARGLDDPAGNS